MKNMCEAGHKPILQVANLNDFKFITEEFLHGKIEVCIALNRNMHCITCQLTW